MIFSSRFTRLNLVFVLLSAIAAPTPNAEAQDGPPKVWTNVDGRQMKATLLRATEKEAEFMLPNGKRALVNLEDLAQGDRERVREFRTFAKYWAKPPKDPEWPDRVTLNWLQAEVEVVEGGAPGEFVYRTPHFEFESDAKLAPNLVQDFCRIFEVTYFALEKNPLGLRLHHPEGGHFKVRLFKDILGYRRAGGVLGAAGVYSTESKEILVPFRSLGLRKANVAWVRKGDVYDPSTLIHEVTHQVLDHWLDVAPIWFNEGLANLVCSARYDSGRLLFDSLEGQIKAGIRGESRPNPMIHDLGGGKFEFPLDVQGLLHASQAQFMGYRPAPTLSHAQVRHNYDSSLILVHFLINDGPQGAQRLRQYLEAYRQAVTDAGILDLDLDDDAGPSGAIVEKKMAIQSQGMETAYPKLAAGRSEKDFFAEMARYYKMIAIQLKPRQ